MRIFVRGLACLGSFGPDVAALQQRLADPLRPVLKDGCSPKAQLTRLNELLPARALRQMGHFTRMALLAAMSAVADAGWPVGDAAEKSAKQGECATGLVLSSGYGPAEPTFSFLDSILEYGESMASSLAFAHSVHNIPAASLARILGGIGPCATVCQLDGPVAAGLLLARQWLLEGRVQRVIFGAVDEITPALARTTLRLTEGAPLRYRASLPLGEAAAFFCLEAGAEPGCAPSPYACIEGIDLGRPECGPTGFLAQADQAWGGALYISGRVPRRFQAEACCQAEAAYGNLPVAQALDMVLALRGKGFGPPAPDAPEQAAASAGKRPTDRAICLNFGQNGLVASVRLAL